MRAALERRPEVKERTTRAEGQSLRHGAKKMPRIITPAPKA